MKINMSVNDPTEKMVDGEGDEDSSFYLRGTLFGTDAPNVTSDAIKNNPNTLPQFFDVFRKQSGLDKSIYTSILENRFELHVDSPTEETFATNNPDSCSCNGHVDKQITEISEVNNTASIIYTEIDDSFNGINYVCADNATNYDQILDPTASVHSLVVINNFICIQGCLDPSSNINESFSNNGNVLTTDVPHEISDLEYAVDTLSEADAIIHEIDIAFVSGNKNEICFPDVIISVKKSSDINDATTTSGSYNQDGDGATFNENGGLLKETADSYKNNNITDIPHIKINNLTNENTKPLFDDPILDDDLEIEISAGINTELLVEVYEYKTTVDVPKSLGEHKQITTADDVQYKLKPKQIKTLKLRKNNFKVLTRQNNKSTFEPTKQDPNPPKQEKQKENSTNQSEKENISPSMLMRDKKVVSNEDQRKKKKWKRQPNESCTCPICHKTYSCLREKRRHVKRHSGEKNHMCMICETSFYSKPELRRHFVKHSKERPYKCESCNKTYCHYPSKVKHIKTKHRV